MIENANYELMSDENGMIMVAYSDKYLWREKRFTVRFDEVVNEIVIDKYERLANGTIKQPAISTAMAYITQAKQLEFTN